jgi:hypothetical protein
MLESLAEYIMRLKLLEKQHKGSMEYIEASTRGYGELEEKRHQNTMKQMAEQTELYMARDPELNRLSSIRYLRKRQGLPTEDIDKEINLKTTQIGDVVSRAVTGESMTPDMFRAIASITPEMLDSFMGQTFLGARQKEQIKKVEEPKAELESTGQELRERERLTEEERIKAEREATSAKVAETERLKRTTPTKEKKREQELEDLYYKNYIDGINAVEDWFKTQGVLPEGLDRSWALERSTGRILDPSDPKYSGEILKNLTFLKFKLYERSPLTEQDKLWLANIRKTSEIQGRSQFIPGERGLEEKIITKGKGLPNPETGLFPDEEESIKNQVDIYLFNSLIQRAYQKGIKDPETARTFAIRYLQSLGYQPIIK